RQRFGTRRIWAFFQPHTYSRTRALLGELAASFDAADHVLVAEIYAAREKDTLGVSGRDIVGQMVHRDARFVSSLEEATVLLCEELRPGDVLVTLGAGDGYLVGERVLTRLSAQGALSQRES
ncbi:MAG TPA: cyanophycin synthetase, partial [Anaerolineae bacterium]|nr:cyanophycin synthetase [Anaerolineae bacterium]